MPRKLFDLGVTGLPFKWENGLVNRANGNFMPSKVLDNVEAEYFDIIEMNGKEKRELILFRT